MIDSILFRLIEFCLWENRLFFNSFRWIGVLAWRRIVFFHQFSRKFDILNRTRIINVHVDILYKRKTQKINSMNVEIMNESESRIDSKWKEILKLSVTSKFVEQLSDVYDSFLISKFSKIKQNFKLTSKRLQKMLFDAKLFPQERKLILKLLYRRKAALI